jgi:hypothetical protein
MSDRPKTRLRLANNFDDLIARAGLTKLGLAKKARVSYATVKALINPSHSPYRTGGMRRDTAWKLAKAYAEAAGVDEETAFARIVVEEPAGAVAA